MNRIMINRLFRCLSITTALFVLLLSLDCFICIATDDSLYTVDGQVIVPVEELTESPEMIADHFHDPDDDAVSIDYFPGYVHRVNNSGVITCTPDASAARDVLRYSAKLDDLDDQQKKAADVDFNGVINAADARLILRYAAKLSGFPVTLRVGQTLRFGWFSALWELRPVTGSSAGFTVEVENIPAAVGDVPEPGDVGLTAVLATVTAPGEYTLEIVYVGYTGEVEQSVLFEITCAG